MTLLKKYLGLIKIMLCCLLMHNNNINAIDNNLNDNACNEFYKINSTPVVQTLKLVKYLPDYMALHLDYFLSDTSQRLSNGLPIFSMLLVNYLIASCFNIQGADSILYMACALLSADISFSAITTLTKSNSYIQLLWMFVFICNDFIFPGYATINVLCSYLPKLKPLAFIPAGIYGYISWKTLLANIRFRIKALQNIRDEYNGKLAINPKLTLLKKMIANNNNTFLYADSLKATDNTTFKNIYKWLGKHTDDIALNNLLDIMTGKLELDDSEEIFYLDRDIFNEDIQSKVKFATHYSNYFFTTLEDLPVIINPDYKLAFINYGNNISASHYEKIKQMLDRAPMIILESLRKNFATNEQLYKGEYTFFAVARIKGKYNFFIGLNFATRDHNCLIRLLTDFPKMLLWYVSLGNIKFSYQPVVRIIVKKKNLESFFKKLIECLQYDRCQINCYIMQLLQEK